MMDVSRPALVLFSFFLLSVEPARAVCSAPPAGTSVRAGGVAGEITLSSGAGKLNKLMYCGGTTWMDLGGSKTATACTKNGEISYSGSQLRYCNSLTNTYWLFDSSGVTGSACSKAGEFRFNGPGLEFCDGTSLRIVASSDTDPDTLSSTGSVTTNDNLESGQVSILGPVSGATSATTSVTFNTAACPMANARICADAACSAFIGTTLLSNGSLSLPTGSFLRLALTAAGTGSTECSISAAYGSQNLLLSSTTTATDTTPTTSPYPLSDYGKPSNTVVVSSIFKVYSHTGVTASISAAGSGGGPQFQVCNDSTCSVVAVPWTSSPTAITNPQWLQIRTTTGASSLDLKQTVLTMGTTSVAYLVTTATCPYKVTLTAGQTLTCTCPVNSATAQMGLPTGDLNYRQLSTNVCVAAVHSGAISNASGGSVTLVGTSAGSPSGTCASFPAVTRNGINSQTGGSGASFYFSGFGTDICH